MLYHSRQGSGPDLVLLHGFGFHHEVWQQLVPVLAADFTVHLIDLPGHGLSHNVNMPTALDECVEVVIDLFPKKAHVLAWSLGGLIASKLSINFPERVHSLALIASTPCFLEKENWCGVRRDFFNDFYQRITENKKKALQYFLLLCLLDRNLQKRYNKEALKLLFSQKIPTTETLVKSLHLLANNDLREEIKNINHQLVYCVSEKDLLTGYNSSLNQIKLPCNGHIPMLTHPEILLSFLRNFFNGYK